MIRFISKIFLISIFFVGLGAVTDNVLKIGFPSENECLFEQKLNNEVNHPRVIRVIKTSNEQYQLRMILPNIENSENGKNIFKKPIAQKNIVVLSQDIIVE